MDTHSAQDFMLRQMTHLVGEMGGVKSTLATMAKSVEEIKSEDLRQNEQLTHQNILLQEHIQGTKTNTQALEEYEETSRQFRKLVEARLAQLEKGPDFRDRLKKVGVEFVTVVTAIGGAVYVTLQILDFFT